MNERFSKRLKLTLAQIEKLKRDSCPKVIIHGWWWKKYFKKYRDISEVMNTLMMHDWMNGGYEQHQAEFEKIIKHTFDEYAFDMFKNGFSTKQYD